MSTKDSSRTGNKSQTQVDIERRLEGIDLPPHSIVEKRTKCGELKTEHLTGDKVPLGQLLHRKEELDSTKGIKNNDGKLFHELDFDFIKQMSERMASNKDNGKYPMFNWKKGMDEEQLRQAAFRHMLEIMEGRYEDDGRPFGHIEALATNMMMLNYQVKNKLEKS